VRIAQVSPLFESVPPKYYGGTERVVSYLTEALVDLGHEVTLFASGDSRTRARLVPICPQALRLAPDLGEALPYHLLAIEEISKRRDEFDIIHFHLDYLHYPISRRLGWTQLTTLHGRLDMPELQPLYDEFGEMPIVSISDAQRRPLPQANWCGTVYHGLPPDSLTLDPGPGEYLAFLGRISPEKRVDRAIEIARGAGLPLRIAAKVDRADERYFEHTIEPLLSQPGIDYIGEIADADKNTFLGRAIALLFPIDWEEPFGLVVIEAIACGTPVIAWPRGSVPEIIDEGVTGYVVASIDEGAEAVGKARKLDRRTCRDVFEQRFTSERMARDYLRIYRQLTGAAPELASERQQLENEGEVA
jgi:glycosyltransferase involved in cell wall biosynthesis